MQAGFQFSNWWGLWVCYHPTKYFSWALFFTGPFRGYSCGTIHLQDIDTMDHIRRRSKEIQWWPEHMDAWNGIDIFGSILEFVRVTHQPLGLWSLMEIVLQEKGGPVMKLHLHIPVWNFRWGPVQWNASQNMRGGSVYCCWFDMSPVTTQSPGSM